MQTHNKVARKGIVQTHNNNNNNNNMQTHNKVASKRIVYDCRRWLTRRDTGSCRRQWIPPPPVSL